uniref:F-box domain-containing protein n=1 Tax=Oryza punctata TaxID=4537 RepID=A0A0E0LI86_ORYPU
MPEDMVREVLLRLPPKEATRFRAVCRPWRATLSDPRFVAAHAARRAYLSNTLLIAGAPYRSSPGSGHVDLVGLAGDVVRRTRVEEGVLELSTCGDLACVVGTDRRARVLHPVTSASAGDPLPRDLDEESKPWAGWLLEERFHAFTHAFGHASSTGEYKVLRVARLSLDQRHEQLVEVLALDRAGRAHAGVRWRGMQSPPFHLAGASTTGMAVVDGVVHFLAVHIPLTHYLPFEHNDDAHIDPGAIARFDLDTEQWRPPLRGPLNTHQIQQHTDLPPPLLTLTELKGFLVTVHRDRSQQTSSSMDLSFLINSEEESWVKEYKIQVQLCPREFYAHPLLVFDERMIVLCVRPKGRVMVYDLETGKCRDLGVGDCVEVGVHKGCLLDLGSVVDNDKE